MSEPKTMCVHDHEIKTLNIQYFPPPSPPKIDIHTNTFGGNSSNAYKSGKK